MAAADDLERIWPSRKTPSGPIVPRGTPVTPEPATPDVSGRFPPVALEGGDPALSSALQSVATPLERGLNAITAPGRGMTRAIGEALQGRSPLVQMGAGRQGSIKIPFYEGMEDPSMRWAKVLQELSGPEQTIAMPSMSRMKYGAGRYDTTTTHRLLEAPGLGLDIGTDPATWTGFGGLTRAGRAYRAAKTDLEAARMAVAGALDWREAMAATQRYNEAIDRAMQAERAVRAEGTLATRGRAAVQFGGKTLPVLAGGPPMATAQSVMRKAARSRLGRGISEYFQPVEQRVSPAIRARGFRVEAARDVGRREAMRGIDDLVTEFPDVVKAVGGDREGLEDALSMALERSQARRFDNPTDWLTRQERERYWGAIDDADRKELEAIGRKRAERALPSFLSPAERAQLTQAGKARKQIAARRQILEGPEEWGPRNLSSLSPAELAEFEAGYKAKAAEIRARTDAMSDEEIGRIAGMVEQKYGNEVSADNTRDFFEDYNKNLTTRSLYSPAVHEAASRATKIHLQSRISAPRKSGYGVVTGGGPGSGKTVGLPDALKQSADVVYDAASGKGTKRVVRQILDSDRQVFFLYTYRKPLEAWREGVLTRGTRQGRVVPAGLAAEAHTRGIGVTREIVEENADAIRDGKLQFWFVDNTRGKDDVRIYKGDEAIRRLYQVEVPDEAKVLSDFRAETRRAADEGRIPFRVYAGANYEIPRPGVEPAVARGAPEADAARRAGDLPGPGDHPAPGGIGGAPGGPVTYMFGRTPAQQQVFEHQFQLEGQWQRLMGATDDAAAAEIVGKLSPDDARGFLARLDAAPGDNPRARAALIRQAAGPSTQAMVRAPEEVMSKAYRAEQRAVRKELAKLANDDDAARVLIRNLSTSAQSRAAIRSLQASVHSARRMYFRGASQEAANRFGDYAVRTIDRINLRNATMFSNTVREGVDLSELVDPQTYMFHAATPELQKSILAFEAERGTIPKGMGWREFTEKHGPQLSRKLRMTAVEANELAQAGKLSVNGGKPIKRAFYTNPFIAQVFREQAGAGAIGYARHLREVANVYGLPVRQAPRHWKTVPNKVLGIGERIAFEPEVADHLTRHARALQNPGAALAAYDRLNQIWKSYTLNIFPVYHTRNELSDIWNGIILGGGDLRWAAPAMDELLEGTKLARRSGGQGIKFDDGRTFSVGQLRDEAEEYGILQSQQLRQEIEQNVLGRLADPDAGGLPGAPAVRRVSRAIREAGAGETGGRKIASKVGAGLHSAQRQLTDNRAIETALAIGNLRESALRLTLYIDRRARGWHPESAALWVKKHLIDYGQLSEFEQKTMRRVFPFYTWTRHNAPLQLEYLFAKPGAFGAVQKMRTAAGGEEGLGVEEPLPQFLSEGLPIRTGTSKKGDPEFWRLEGTWPGADALLPLSPLLDPGTTARRGLSMLNPLTKEIAEQGTGVDFWRSKPGKAVYIEDYPGQKGSFLGMPMDRRTIHALQNVRPLTELNRLNPGELFGTTESPAFGGLGAVREYPDIDPDQRWLNLFLGRGYAVDPERNASDWDRAVRRALSSLEREISVAEAQGKTARAQSARRRYEYILEHPETISPDMAK